MGIIGDQNLLYQRPCFYDVHNFTLLFLIIYVVVNKNLCCCFVFVFVFIF